MELTKTQIEWMRRIGTGKLVSIPGPDLRRLVDLGYLEESSVRGDPGASFFKPTQLGKGFLLREEK